MPLFKKSNHVDKAPQLPPWKIAIIDDESAVHEVTKLSLRNFIFENRGLVLRTGQLGQAPEEEVIKSYDINDYKAKTELSSSKLKSCVYTAIRSET